MRRALAGAVLSCALAGCSLGQGRDAADDAVRTRSAPAREVYHQSEPYRLQNSLRGLRLAARGYPWIDIDANYCWDADRRRRVAIATHWPVVGREHFTDPAGRVPPDARFSDLTLPEVRRLRSADPKPFHILTMTEMFRAAERAGLTGIEWEVKGGAAFERPAIYRPVLAVARKVGIEVEVKTLTTIGGESGALRRLRAAARAGAATMLLTHDPVQISDREARYVDVVRGPWQAG